MRDMTEIRNEIEEILNIYAPFRAIKDKQILISQLLELVEREQNKSYDNGYRLKSQKLRHD